MHHLRVHPPSREHFRIHALLPVVGLVVALGLLIPSNSVAQSPSPEEIEAFEDYLKRGSELLEAEEYRKSIDEFEKARAVIDHPRIVFTIATAYERWGRCGQAEQRYRDVLARKDTNEKISQKARGHLDTLDSCVDKSTLIVDCQPQDATVQIGGDLFTCGERIEIAAGETSIEVSAPSYEEKSRQITLPPEETLRERVELEPLPQAGGSKRWMTYAGYGALGIGAGLLVGGFFSDVAAVKRADQLQRAQQAADMQRVLELEKQAKSARARTIALYAVGTIAVGAGVTLQIIAPPPSSESETARKLRLDVTLRPTDVAATIRW